VWQLVTKEVRFILLLSRRVDYPMSFSHLCLFSSTPDIFELNFMVKVLTGTPQELARGAVDWGYDGIEFMPNPDRIPDPEEFKCVLRDANAAMPVVNTGRMAFQKMALLHEDRVVRRKSIQAFKGILDFAGCLKARVGLGVAQGWGLVRTNKEETDRVAEDVFRELAAHAEEAGAEIMLEPVESDGCIRTMVDVMAWVERIGSTAFSAMLDTYQLSTSESNIEQGIRVTKGRAQHIHLYDPDRWPPGVLPEQNRLDWQHITRVLGEVGFRGSGSVVLAPEGDPEIPARKAVAYLRSLWPHESETASIQRSGRD